VLQVLIFVCKNLQVNVGVMVYVRVPVTVVAILRQCASQCFRLHHPQIPPRPERVLPQTGQIFAKEKVLVNVGVTQSVSRPETVAPMSRMCVGFLEMRTRIFGKSFCREALDLLDHCPFTSTVTTLLWL